MDFKRMLIWHRLKSHFINLRSQNWCKIANKSSVLHTESNEFASWFVPFCIMKAMLLAYKRPRFAFSNHTHNRTFKHNYLINKTLHRIFKNWRFSSETMLLPREWAFWERQNQKVFCLQCHKTQQAEPALRGWCAYGQPQKKRQTALSCKPCGLQKWHKYLIFADRDTC